MPDRIRLDQVCRRLDNDTAMTPEQLAVEVAKLRSNGHVDSVGIHRNDPFSMPDLV